jgi:hypothetical protein
MTTICNTNGTEFSVAPDCPKPETIQELKDNAILQFNNVDGWMNVAEDYECALIYARFLVQALEKLVASASKQ